MWSKASYLFFLPLETAVQEENSKWTERGLSDGVLICGTGGEGAVQSGLHSPVQPRHVSRTLISLMFWAFE